MCGFALIIIFILPSQRNTFNECARQVSFQFRFDVYYDVNTVTAQHLANWYAVFGSYAYLTKIARNTSCRTVEECRRMETLLQVLTGVLEDYNKVVRPRIRTVL